MGAKIAKEEHLSIISVTKMTATLVETSKIVELLECTLETKTLLSGTLLKWMDIIACLAAEKHAAVPCVTATVDDLQFKKTIRLGQVITLKAWVNRAFNTSMEIEVSVFTEDISNMHKSKICQAFFTFVTQVDQNGNKQLLKPIEPLTDEEKAQFILANERKKMRLAYKASLKKMKENCTIDSEENLTSVNNDTISPSSTYCECVEIVLPQHANHHSTTFGGQLMAWMESTSTISARRLCRTQPRLVAVDEVFFRAPSKVGDRVVIQSRVNNTFYRSLEVGVRVEAYAVGGPRRHIQSAYFTYISPDQTGNPMELPNIKPQNQADHTRMKRSEARFRMRQERRAIISSSGNRFDKEPMSPLPPMTPLNSSSISVSLTKDNEKFLCYRNILALMELYESTDFQTVMQETYKLSTCQIAGGLCIRMEVEIELPPSSVYNILRDYELRKHWDPIVMDTIVKQEICKDEDYILHLLMKNLSIGENIKGDDFVLLASNRKDSSGTYAIAYCSVIVDSIPPIPEYHRAENFCSGFIFESISQTGGCKITYINQVTAHVFEYFKSDLGIAGGAADMLKQRVFSMMEYIRQNAS